VRPNHGGLVTHAVIIPAQFIDKSAARSELDGLVSRISSMPGFVAGYWVAMPGDRGTAMIVFDSHDAAQAFVVSVRSGPPYYWVTLGSIEVGEVWAHA
jgi:hypothetical protein